MVKWIYSFGDGKAEGDASMKNLLGGKGANLAQMSKIGLPVPLGITITTEVCNYYYENSNRYPEDLELQLNNAISELEKKLGKEFGNPNNPLLVSVRSGARASMPGMMDTVLNLGINDEVAESLAQKTNNPRFVYDSYRRFIQMYADVVMEVDHYNFEQILDIKKNEKNVVEDLDLDADDLKDLVVSFKKIVKEITNKDFPEDPKEQLWGAIGAVFDSWMNKRAITYRKMHEIPAEWGTAVNVQSMVFGNMGDDCATGVAFTRNPSTGEKALYGEYLINAQGEDVVAGIRTPCPITLASKTEQDSDLPAMEESLPELFKELEKIYEELKLRIESPELADKESLEENRIIQEKRQMNKSMPFLVAIFSYMGIGLVPVMAFDSYWDNQIDDLNLFGFSLFFNFIILVILIFVTNKLNKPERISQLVAGYVLVGLSFFIGVFGQIGTFSFFNQIGDSSQVKERVTYLTVDGGQSKESRRRDGICYDFQSFDDPESSFGKTDICEGRYLEISEGRKVLVRYKEGNFGQKWMIDYHLK